jgi:hypothetical protein
MSGALRQFDEVLDVRQQAVPHSRTEMERRKVDFIGTRQGNGRVR